jgi:protein O-mannosyl-transferase
VKRNIKTRHQPAIVKTPPQALQGVVTDRWKYYTLLAVIVLISAIVYLPVFHNGLLAWDDEGYIMKNALVHSINLKEIFSQNVMGNWHPVTILMFAIEYHFFGLNPAGYHAVNLLLHLLNVLLVFYTVYLISDKAPVALIASLLFGVHPLHVESVAWVAELKDLLYTFFFLASYIFYLKYLKNPQKKYYIFALLLFLVSLLSKAMAASLPLVLVLTDYFKGRKIDKKTLFEKVPFFLLALTFGVLAVLAQKSSDSIQAETIFSFPQRLVFAAYGFISYLFKLVLPLNHSSFYPYPSGGIPVLFYAYLLLFLGLAFWVVYSHRFSRKIIFGMGFFTLTILLVLQLLPVGEAIMADRYSYIPSIGIFYLAGEGLAYLWGKKQKWSAIALLSAAAIMFSVKTYARCGVWKNDITLWTDVINQYKTVARAYNNRGIAFVNDKRNDEAMKDFNKAIELKPGYADAYTNRGNLFRSENRNDEAIKDFNKAIELIPDYAEPYNNRGTVFLNEKRYGEAIKDFNKAIELNPKNAESYYNRGIVFVYEKRTDEAVNDFNRAIKLKPDFAGAFANRGTVFMNEKRNDEAIEDFNKAVELKPDFAEVYNNRGIVFIREKKNREAVNDFNRAIELNPGYISAYINKANLLFDEQRFEEAVSAYSMVIALRADYAQAYYKRGLAKFSSGKINDACMDLKKAASLGFGSVEDPFYKLCK